MLPSTPTTGCSRILAMNSLDLTALAGGVLVGNSGSRYWLRPVWLMSCWSMGQADGASCASPERAPASRATLTARREAIKRYIGANSVLMGSYASLDRWSPPETGREGTAADPGTRGPPVERN